LSHYLFFLAVVIEETVIANISSVSFVKSLKGFNQSNNTKRKFLGSHFHLFLIHISSAQHSAFHIPKSEIATTPTV